ncbi:transcription factor DIVARICATA-like protein isoform X1 [Cinnamomum micranthum f. kanehirae]|uniref:Transcription factor DIVARICATA-like protein isoform X1 n=1 Tax=Cinnamomum micranthum f. kanehirae TaxID=337451 RepID=A0A443Q2A6_9MAGN|nr:transcription factor DIVARICATA-like protein isoform X1 [Cinnamomum micranthum f. kanehirae]
MLRGDYLAMIGSSSAWSRTQDKLFERALVLFPEDTPDRWERIAAEVPGKDPTEVRDHYEVLVHDVGEIDSGRVAVPSYTENSFTPEWWGEEGPSQISFGGGKGKGAENERKKGVPWTEEEHRLFLIGLQKYGKGDWRSISRNAVVSRTPTQVASHAQKYYLRLNSVKKEKKRSSIHDITTVQSGQVAQPSEQRLANAVQGPTQQPMGPPKFSQNPALQPMGPPKYSNLPHSQAMGALKFAEGPYLGQFREQGSSGYQQFGFPM